MNPHDGQQWIAVFEDGRTSFNEGKGYTFDGSGYTKWCAINFGAVKVIGTEPALAPHDKRSELEESKSTVELETERETAELEANAPALPPRIPAPLAELEDRGGPKVLPGTAVGVKTEFEATKSSSSLRSRLSRLKPGRTMPSINSGNSRAELEG